jgi:hypothetical protein
MDGGENQNTMEINTRFHHAGGTSLNAQIAFQISACFFSVILLRRTPLATLASAA